MAWTDVEWTSGDTLPESKLDNMQGNLDHLRAEEGYLKVLGCSGGWSEGVEIYVGGYTQGAGNECRLRLEPMAATSSWASVSYDGISWDKTSWFTFGMSGVHVETMAANQLHRVDVNVEWRESGAGATVYGGLLGVLYFVRTPDIERIRIRGNWVCLRRSRRWKLHETSPTNNWAHILTQGVQFYGNWV